MERIHSEQRRAADYIATRGPEAELAWLGLSDWIAEEVLILTEGAD